MIYLATRQCAVAGLGQFSGRTRPIEPLLDTALKAAEITLATTDPKVHETFGYVRRIVGAQPLFGPAAKKKEPGKLSDLNPVLSKATKALENPVYVVLALLAVPVIAFALGRVSKRRRT